MSVSRSFPHLYRRVCDTIKVHRTNYIEYCEDESELENTLRPIEQSPAYYYSLGRIRPVLKKYAMYLCEKVELECIEKKLSDHEEEINMLKQTTQYLSAQVKLLSGNHNIGEKDESLLLLRLFHQNQTKQYEMLIAIFFSIWVTHKRFFTNTN